MKVFDKVADFVTWVLYSVISNYVVRCYARSILRVRSLLHLNRIVWIYCSSSVLVLRFLNYIDASPECKFENLQFSSVLIYWLQYIAEWSIMEHQTLRANKRSVLVSFRKYTLLKLLGHWSNKLLSVNWNNDQF